MSTQTLTIEQAQRVVLDHGHKVSLRRDGRLWGGIAYSQRQPDGSLTTGTEWTPVPLTVPALRDWLGY